MVGSMLPLGPTDGESSQKNFQNEKTGLIAVPDDRIKAADYIPIKNFENKGSLTNFGVVYCPLVQ